MKENSLVLLSVVARKHSPNNFIPHFLSRGKIYLFIYCICSIYFRFVVFKPLNKFSPFHIHPFSILLSYVNMLLILSNFYWEKYIYTLDTTSSFVRMNALYPLLSFPIHLLNTKRYLFYFALLLQFLVLKTLSMSPYT